MIGAVCANLVGRQLTTCYFIVIVCDLWSTVLPFWLAIGHAEKGCGVVGALEWGAWEDIMLLMYCAMPNCVLFLWTIWGREPLYFWWGWAFILELKFHLLHTMFVWFAAFSGHSFSSLKEFLDLCKFNRLSLKHFLCTWGSFSFSS